MTTWYPVIIHFGDNDREKALARVMKKGIYASSYHFGINLRHDQYKDVGLPVWWEKTGISDDHRAMANTWRDDVREWPE